MKRVSSRKASDRSATITANGTLPPSRRCPSSPETSANPGTCPGLNGKGMQMNFDGGMWNSVPIGDNPVTKKISISGRFNAIDHPLEMTATTDGVVGGDRLTWGIKFMALYEAGCFGNSSSDLNWAASVLEDESKCEFILGS